MKARHGVIGDDIRARLHDYDHVIKAVYPSVGQPGFAYTIGRSRRGLPELVLIGLPMHFAYPILTEILKMQDNGSIPKDIASGGSVENVPGLFANDLAVSLRDLEDRKTVHDEWTCQIQNALRTDDLCQVVQVVLPDRLGHMPEDPECDAETVGVQNMIQDWRETKFGLGRV